MSAINDFLSGVKRKYPKTQAVREQIEELRDTLNLKSEEYRKLGQSEEEAEKAAVDSIGDVASLFDEVSGKVRTVYINHLRRNNAAFMFHLVLFEMIGAWLLFRYVLIDYYYFLNDIYGITFETYLPFVFVFVGMGAWLLVAFVIWKRDSKRTATIALQYKKMMIRSIVIWLFVSLAAALILVIDINSLFSFGAPDSIFAISVLIPILGALNLPLGVFIYHRQFTGGFYDVQ